MTKVLLSKSEWQAIDDYINFSIANPDPCDGCEYSGTCFGCLEKQIYLTKIKEIGVNELMEFKDVKLYVELSIKYAKVQNELVKAQEIVKKVSTELVAVKARFIEEPKTEPEKSFEEIKDDFQKKEVRPRKIKFSCLRCKTDFEIPFYTCEAITPNWYRYDCPLCHRVCLYCKNWE